MAPGLGGIDINELAAPSKSFFASSYPFWERVGATMWDIVIGCGAFIGFGIVVFMVLAFAALGWEMLRAFFEWVRE